MEGQRGLCFFWWGGSGGVGGWLRGGGLEIFQTVPFCFQRKPHLCKCALCPLAYCLNSIVDFLWEAHRGLGGQGGQRGTKGGSAE